MNWDRLKNNKCPECGQGLSQEGNIHKCENCEFKIGDIKFSEIVNRLYTKRKYVPREDNMEALNNL